MVLVIGRHVRDRSRFKPAVVREYLRQLGVPLLVWATYEPEGETSWGVATGIGSPWGLDKAAQGLRQKLDRQVMVWLVGYHLLRDIELRTAEWEKSR